MNEITILILCFAVGYILLTVEFIFIPGFGLAGIIGFGSLIGGCVLTWQFFGPLVGSLVSVLSLGVAGIAFIAISRSKAGKQLILDHELRDEDGVQEGPSVPPTLIGKTGLAITDLRPVGTVTIEDERYDALTDGEYIDKGSNIKVIETRGNNIVVEKI